MCTRIYAGCDRACGYCVYDLDGYGTGGCASGYAVEYADEETAEASSFCVAVFCVGGECYYYGADSLYQ